MGVLGPPGPEKRARNVFLPRNPGKMVEIPVEFDIYFAKVNRITLLLKCPQIRFFQGWALFSSADRFKTAPCFLRGGGPRFGRCFRRVSGGEKTPLFRPPPENRGCGGGVVFEGSEKRPFSHPPQKTPKKGGCGGGVFFRGGTPENGENTENVKTHKTPQPASEGCFRRVPRSDVENEGSGVRGFEIKARAVRRSRLLKNINNRNIECTLFFSRNNNGANICFFHFRLKISRNFVKTHKIRPTHIKKGVINVFFL